MDYIIKKVNNEEIDKGLALIWRTFKEFIAPDYTEEAVSHFKENRIDNPDYKQAYVNGIEVMYGAYVKGELAGVLSVKGGEFISCAFVDKKYHRMGIASGLFNKVLPILKENGAKKIRLNSSPYAVPFYHSIGFKDISQQQVYQGILFTPMELIL